MSAQVKKDLIDHSQDLQYEEHLQLFKIIKDNSVKYTENSNGVFVDLGNVSSKIVKELSNFVKLCHDNRKMEESRNVLLEQAKKNVDQMYENKINRKEETKTSGRKAKKEEVTDEEDDDEDEDDVVINVDSDQDSDLD